MSDLKKLKALTAAIAAAFVANPTAKELHVTEDGNCFLSANKNAADLHARRNNQTVNTITREDFEGNKGEALKAATEALEAREKEAVLKAEAEAKALEEKELEEAALKELAKKEAAEKAKAEAAAKLEEESRDAATGKSTSKSTKKK